MYLFLLADPPQWFCYSLRCPSVRSVTIVKLELGEGSRRRGRRRGCFLRTGEGAVPFARKLWNFTAKRVHFGAFYTLFNTLRATVLHRNRNSGWLLVQICRQIRDRKQAYSLGVWHGGQLSSRRVPCTSPRRVQAECVRPNYQVGTEAGRHQLTNTFYVACRNAGR